MIVAAFNSVCYKKTTIRQSSKDSMHVHIYCSLLTTLQLISDSLLLGNTTTCLNLAESCTFIFCQIGIEPVLVETSRGNYSTMEECGDSDQRRARVKRYVFSYHQQNNICKHWSDDDMVCWFENQTPRPYNDIIFWTMLYVCLHFVTL